MWRHSKLAVEEVIKFLRRTQSGTPSTIILGCPVVDHLMILTQIGKNG